MTQLVSKVCRVIPWACWREERFTNIDIVVFAAGAAMVGGVGLLCGSALVF